MGFAVNESLERALVTAREKLLSSSLSEAQVSVWPIFSLSETELVAGRDNKHLDFRISVLKEASGEASSVVVSTVCTVHNAFGKIYLFFVVPIHKWGVRRLLIRAIAAGRL